MKLVNKDYKVIAISFIAILLFGIVLNFFTPKYYLIILISVTLFIVLTFIFETYRRLHGKIDESILKARVSYRQTEDLFSLYFSVKPQSPLPDLRGWSASPDYLKQILLLIDEKDVGNILELGSGASSIIIGRFLQSRGKGKLVSIEQDEEYANKTRKLVEVNKIQDFVEVQYKPVKDVKIGNDNWSWYDIRELNYQEPFDMLLIDGPSPNEDQKLVRYPALPLLKSYLREGASILLDDAFREDEKMVVRKWLENDDTLTKRYISTEKGMCILTVGKDTKS